MGELTDKIKGSANEAAGNVKQAVGKATDNERNGCRWQDPGTQGRSPAGQG